MVVSVRNYKLRSPMSNQEIAQKLGISFYYGKHFGLFLNGHWVGGIPDLNSFTLSLSVPEHLHKTAEKFATFTHES